MIDLKEKFEELSQLILGFIADQVTCNELQSFSWELIDYFAGTPVSDLPNEEAFEKILWYAVWEIQHLCDDDHQNDGTTRRELLKVLSYVRGDEKMPEDCVGRRP